MATYTRNLGEQYLEASYDKKVIESGLNSSPELSGLNLLSIQVSFRQDLLGYVVRVALCDHALTTQTLRLHY